MTGEEYMVVLLERQAAWEAEHVINEARPWVRPLLEWFIRDGDELLFTPPPVAPQPKRETQPRVYRSAASLREERDRLAARCAPLVAPLSPDRAASSGQALGRRRTAKLQQREDGRLQRYVALSRRIDKLDDRIKRAEARERRVTS